MWNGFQLTERTQVHVRNGYVQRAITPKVGKQELQFICSACCLIVLYSYVKFCENISVFNLQSRNGYMVEMARFNVQRARTPKIGKPELGFMCSACRLIVLYFCVKFGENISDSIRVMERTQIMEVLMDGRTLKISDGIT